MYGHDGGLACEIRDGLLQDLVAIGLLIEGARRQMRDGGAAEADMLLQRAAEAVGSNLDEVRDVIDRLQAAPCAA